MGVVADLWSGPVQHTQDVDICIVRLVSWLDTLHKQEFERGEKKHYFKYQHVLAKQEEGKKKFMWI